MVIRAGTAAARNLRTRQTEAERKLWSRLRNRNLDGFKFRRQFPIDRYVVDFACIEAKLVVDLDGSQHAEQEAYDAQRTVVLEGCGFHVLRFWNYQVLKHMDDVLPAIWRALKRDFRDHDGPPQPPTPAAWAPPSPHQGEGVALEPPFETESTPPPQRLEPGAGAGPSGV
jgi:very-short-patch-repair endonuclease